MVFCLYRQKKPFIFLELSHVMGKNVRHPALLLLYRPKLINKKVFIMGDFNINLLNFESHVPTNDFVNTFFSYNFLPCINHPTRISHNSSTIIDNIFTNLTNLKITCGNIVTQISNHFPQFLILKNANWCNESSLQSIFMSSSLYHVCNVLLSLCFVLCCC